MGVMDLIAAALAPATSIVPVLVSQPKPKPVLFEFSPSTLTLDDTKDSTPIQVKLKKKPSNDVKVYFSHDSVNFNKCLLEFNSTNWNVSQSVFVQPVQQFTITNATYEFNMNFKSFSKDDDYDEMSAAYPCKRKAYPAGSCSATGDPHYSTFNKISYSTYTSGTFYLTKSDQLTVQITIYNNVYTGIIKTVAARYGSTTAVFDQGFTKPVVNGSEIIL